MRVLAHVCASALAGGCVALIGREPVAGASLFVVGSLLDLDHLRHYSGIGLELSGPRGLLDSLRLSQKELEAKHDFRRGVPAGPAFPLLHSAETLAALLAVSFGLGCPPLLIGACAGMALHLLMDSRAYPCSPMFFSLAWRITHWKSRLREEWRRFP